MTGTMGRSAVPFLPATFGAPAIDAAVAALGVGPLTEEGLRSHLFPLFSRVLARQEIYLANHSLGRPLDCMADDVGHALDLWYTDMDDAWSAWLTLIDQFRGGIARLINVPCADAVVCKTSAGQGLRAVLNALSAECPHVLSTRGEFDSIDVILKTYTLRGKASVTWCEPDQQGIFSTASIVRAIENVPGSLDLVVIAQVFFATGQLLSDLAPIIAAAHARGALVMIDMYHSAGAIPVDFAALDADFAIGGSYKYLRGGPGACWLAINPRLFEGSPLLHPTLDTGWFAKKNPFQYDRPESPEFAAGGTAWLESTPPVLPICQTLASLRLLLGLTVERLHQYNLEQQRALIGELIARNVPVREINPRGAFVLLPQSDAMGFSRLLKSNGVNTDARSGHVRLCPDILNTREEMRRAAEIIGTALHAQ